MNIIINDISIWLILFSTFITSYLLVFVVKKVAIHVNAIDYPNERKIHKVPMPRLGGLAIYCAFLLGYIMYGQISIQMISILIGTFLILLIGMIDDINPIKARYKFIVQLIAASIIVFYGNIFFDELSFVGITIAFPLIISQLISVLFIVSITNAINLIDGLDGLSSGICCIYFITIAIIAYILNLLNGLDVMLCIIMLGSTLGFLIHNFPPAKIFAGDSGSNFLGFMIAVISLLGFKAATLTTIIIPIVILAIPIFDVAFAILRRIIHKKGIAVADKEHFHHQILKLKFSNRISLLLIYAINILFASVSIFYALGDKEIAMIIYIMLMILLLFLVIKTNIIFDHKKTLSGKVINIKKIIKKKKKINKKK